MTTLASTERGALARRVAGAYLVTPDVTAAHFAPMLGRLRAALAYGAVVQYRNKLAALYERRAQAQAVSDIARGCGAIFIVNDDLDLAQELGADGVHLGRTDGDIAAARTRLPQGLVGASCYNELRRAREAVEAGADILAFGSVFASSTKPAAVPASLDLLQQARAAFPEQRIVAIGGIGVGNIAQVSAAGAHAAAVISAVFEAADPAEAARRLNDEFLQGLARHDPQRTAV